MSNANFPSPNGVGQDALQTGQQYEVYKPSDVPLTEDLLPLDDNRAASAESAAWPLSPELAWRSLFTHSEEHVVRRRGK